LTLVGRACTRRKPPHPLALLAVLCFGVAAQTSLAAGGDEPDLEAGRRMYREGIRPSGEPLTAIVTGDVPILGTQLSCQSCHGRSGMGAAEAAYIVPAIAGRFLFAPSPQPARPAYDPESLARALREGVDPAGRALDPLMPRYHLTDQEVSALAAYLAILSAGNSPGVDDEVIRFAAVIAGNVDTREREAVLAVLRTYVAEKNRQTRLESERWDRQYAPASKLPTLFREWVLDEWTLTDPSDGWAEQLETRYQHNPVFALLSGISTGPWAPIGRFCERHEIPCLFPITDMPDAEANDFFTLYFSQGLELEADLIANHIASHPVHTVIQVSCGAAPARAAAALRSALAQQGVKLENLEMNCDGSFPEAELSARMAAAPDAATVLWLRRDQLSTIKQSLPLGRIYVSSTLLDRDLSAQLVTAPGPVFAAHPYRLPGERDPALRRFAVWAKTRGIEIRYPRQQAETFFACFAANDVVRHLRRYFVRDYLLDMLDHAQGLAAYVPIHPRPTLGPGQRFLTKGGYILPVVEGHPDTKHATFILP